MMLTFLKLYKKNLSGKCVKLSKKILSGKFSEIVKNCPSGKFQEIFRKCGKLFPTDPPQENSPEFPGISRKFPEEHPRKIRGGFSENRFVEACYLGKTSGNFPGSSNKFRKISGKFPPGSPREISGGKSGDFFRVFRSFPRATTGYPHQNRDIFRGNSGENFGKIGKSGKSDRTLPGKFFRGKFPGKFFREFRKFREIFPRLRKNPGISQNPLCGAVYAL